MQRHEKYRRHHLKKKFGLTVAEYDEMLRLQHGVCAICKRPPKTRRLNVDHNHRTGAIRGLLCYMCNKGLSFFRDDSAALREAAAYLEDEWETEDEQGAEDDRLMAAAADYQATVERLRSADGLDELQRAEA